VRREIVRPNPTPECASGFVGGQVDALFWLIQVKLDIFDFVKHAS
jgi:hypothetical protein